MEEDFENAALWLSVSQLKCCLASLNRYIFLEAKYVAASINYASKLIDDFKSQTILWFFRFKLLIYYFDGGQEMNVIIISKPHFIV